MANKYHVNQKTGRAGICKATAKRGCPLGSDTPHFDSKEEARAHIEITEKNNNSTFVTSQKKKSPRTSQDENAQSTSANFKNITNKIDLLCNVESNEKIMKSLQLESTFELRSDNLDITYDSNSNRATIHTSSEDDLYQTDFDTEYIDAVPEDDPAYHQIKKSENYIYSDAMWDGYNGASFEHHFKIPDPEIQKLLKERQELFEKI